MREGGGRHAAEEALTTLYELEATIEARRVEKVDEDAKPSWTPDYWIIRNLCKKIREEAGELCQTWEEDEVRKRRRTRWRTCSTTPW